MRIKTKKKGVILLEAIFALILLGMVSYGFAATSTLQYQQLDAVKVAAQAREYAEVEAKYIQALGFYDVDDGIDPDGIHSKKTMESLIGTDEGGNWQSETKLVSTKLLPGFTEDEDVNKIKVISIDVYKTGESMPRFSLSVPLSLQDSSYGVPIGTVMAWPVSEAPKGLHKDRWIECDGRVVDPNLYPRLAKLMDHVPDYRGMFLRGLGSQNYSQHNGLYHGTTATTYSSGGLGDTQGDATRHVYGLLGFMQDAGVLQSGNIDKGHNDGLFYREYSITLNGYSQSLASYPAIGAGSVYNRGERRSVRDSLDSTWAEALKRSNYSLDVSYSSDKDGNSFVSGVNLTKTEEYPELTFWESGMSVAADNEIQVPIAGEIRPVNKAVKYMIKAK